MLSQLHFDKNTKLCYTYDERSRVTQRTKVNYNTGETTDETFTYDAAGNIITTADNCDTDSFSYDKNNRLTYHNGMSVTYDADGNMTSAYHDGSRDSFRYDSTNRLIGTNTNAYTYNAENVRIRNLCGDSETTYVYNTNAKLSSMLMKTTDGVVTKYVYGRGLISEETNGVFKTYHFDYRGSTVAITDINGNVTDRFEYDTYGKLTSRTGNSDVIFLYNGRDGVVTDANGLIYMRARYYSPELRRFINADILAGRIDNAVTLNRYAYANANPVSFVDPFGLEPRLDAYISDNYAGKKTITLVVDTPNINSRVVGNVENSKLDIGHAFIRLDDGNGNIEYVGFGAQGYGLTDMLLARDMDGVFIDDSGSEWDVAKVYELTDEQYSYIDEHVKNLDSANHKYNIETYNCTTFAVDIIEMASDVGPRVTTIAKHKWTLPDNLEEQVGDYSALPESVPAWLAAWVIELAMGDFYGYTPADAAQDLLNAPGTVLLKQDGLAPSLDPYDSIKEIKNAPKSNPLKRTK